MSDIQQGPRKMLIDHLPEDEKELIAQQREQQVEAMTKLAVTREMAAALIDVVEFAWDQVSGSAHPEVCKQLRRIHRWQLGLTITEAEIEAFYAERVAEGLLIDPKTAEVDWDYTEVLDPYGIDPPPYGFSCVGREYFARRPESNIWVCFGDLPGATCEALSAKRVPAFSF